MCWHSGVKGLEMGLIRNKFFLLWEVCPRLPSDVSSPCHLLVMAEYLLIMAWPLPREAAQGDSVASWVGRRVLIAMR